jgi:hypothetical protein
MSSAGNGLTIPSQTKVLLSSLKSSVSFDSITNRILGLPADIVPATFKKKRVAAAPKVKGEEGDEKPGRPTEETARPTGLGRGQR